MPTLDIGCGGNKLGDVGVDIAPWPGVDHVCNLGFEPLPFPDQTFDKVWSQHSIEHVPFVVYDFATGARKYPMVQLLRECHRVLKPGMTMDILTICGAGGGPSVDPRAWQDPTHVSVWTLNTIQHFTAARDSQVGNLNDVMAGLHVPFELVVSELTTDKLLHIVLRRPA